MTDFPNALQKGFRLHEYEIVRVLGVGGFGITYLAFDNHLEKPVAIKEYLPNDLAVRVEGTSVHPKSSSDRGDFQWGLGRFMDEARTLARFDHPSIIRVFRFFEANDTAYIVMEYAEGETLAAHLRDHGPLDEGELKGILLPLLDGLEQVHQADLLHRDIKPDNIMVRADGTPVLIDFGAARLAVTGRSRSLSAVLSPGYAPIEQYSTRGNQGPWTDIYALSAVAYLALTGRKPVEAPERVRNDPLQPAIEAAAGRAESAFLSGVDAGLAVFEDERPRSLSVWRDCLTDQWNSRPKSASSPNPPKAPGPSAPIPPITEGESGSGAAGNGKGSRYPRLMWPGMVLVLAIVIASIFAIRTDLLPDPAPMPVKDPLVAQIQDYLNRLGYQVPEDGVVDGLTTETIRKFEQSQGLMATGTADEALLEDLTEEYDRRDDEAWETARLAHTVQGYQTYVQVHPNGAYIGQVDEQITRVQAEEQRRRELIATEYRSRDEAAWREATGSDTKEAYDRYRERFPDGRYVDQVNERIAQIRDRDAEAGPRQLVADTQQELRRLGRDVNSNGVLDRNTADAIRTFERAMDRPETGQPSEALLAALETTALWPVLQPGETFRDCLQCPEMVVIPGGEFVRGSPTSEVGRATDEGPQSLVTIRPFSLGTSEVTVAEFQRFVDATSYRTDAQNNAGGNEGCFAYRGASGFGWTEGTSWRDPGIHQGYNHPVVCVSWNDAKAYVHWLSEQTGEDYRLPSEAEQEYALRADSTATWPWGGNPNDACDHANVADLSAGNAPDETIKRHFADLSLVECEDDQVFTAPVRSYLKNSFGLYDMTGNVWEWTEDCWHSSYREAPNDGSAWTSGDYCDRAVLRGGSWIDGSRHLRSAFRGWNSRVTRSTYAGFRPARSLRQ